jgi:hypothetical protein
VDAISLRQRLALDKDMEMSGQVGLHGYLSVTQCLVANTARQVSVYRPSVLHGPLSMS